MKKQIGLLILFLSSLPLLASAPAARTGFRLGIAALKNNPTPLVETTPVIVAAVQKQTAPIINNFTMPKFRYTALKQETQMQSAQKQQSQMSREQALEKSQAIIGQMLNPEHQQAVGTYIDQLNEVVPSLDPVHDASAIQAIDFLNKNQHKTSMWDVPFWVSNANVLTQLPIPEQVKQTQGTSQIVSTLGKKLSIPKPVVETPVATPTTNSQGSIGATSPKIESPTTNFNWNYKGPFVYAPKTASFGNKFIQPEVAARMRQQTLQPSFQKSSGQSDFVMPEL